MFNIKKYFIVFLLAIFTGCSLTNTKINITSRLDLPSGTATKKKEVINTKIIDVPLICQYPELPTGCESVAATMFLNYYGISIDSSTFASSWLNSSNYFYEMNGKLYGPNPYVEFVGNPYSYNSYGCFASVIASAINYNQNQIVVHEQNNLSLEKLCEYYILKDHPVLIWATMNMSPVEEGNSWYLYSDEYFVWPAGEHCLVLVGFDEEYYYFNDPQTGNVEKYEKDIAQRRFEEMGSQSITIK